MNFSTEIGDQIKMKNVDDCLLIYKKKDKNTTVNEKHKRALSNY